MVVPNQASWMVRKIMNMRKNWHKLSTCSQLTKRGKFQITAAYKTLRGTIVNVPWKKLTCHNVAALKQVFILWLALLSKLRTKDVLLSWALVWIVYVCYVTPAQKPLHISFLNVLTQDQSGRMC